MKDKGVVVGAGVVGKATAQALGISSFYDKNPNRSNISFEEITDYKYVFLSVPTPTDVDYAKIKVAMYKRK